MINATLRIREAAKMLNVHPQTLRLWEKEGIVTPQYTPHGQRRYFKEDLEKMLGLSKTSVKEVETNRVAIYCRVSSTDQKRKGDLDRQLSRLTAHAINRGYRIVSVASEVGSGMNDARKDIQKLFRLVKDGEVDIILVEHKDRLTRFGLNYLINFFSLFNVRVEWVEESLGKGFEQELVEDILTLMVSFSAKIYGRRSHKNAKVVQE